MAAISVAIAHGNDGFQLNHFSVGVSAPGTLDFEFRFNTTDANANVITRKDIIIALEAIMRAIESSNFIITPQGL